jgi:hypothetical protein
MRDLRIRKQRASQFLTLPGRSAPAISRLKAAASLAVSNGVAVTVPSGARVTARNGKPIIGGWYMTYDGRVVFIALDTERQCVGQGGLNA